MKPIRPKMSSLYKKTFYASILIPIILVPFILVVNEGKSCDEHVVLEDGTEYDCSRVLSYVNGMSTINTCGGERINVVTNRIKKITKIQNR